eukprot:COSAG06_NODE_562_length_14275_cov_28.599041_2_plen_123_part_00
MLAALPALPVRPIPGLDLLFSSLALSKATLSVRGAPTARPLSHPLRYYRNAAAAASPKPGGGRAATHGRRRRARGRGRKGVGGPERAGARDEAIFRRRELAFPSSRWAAVFLRVRARRQQRA